MSLVAGLTVFYSLYTGKCILRQNSYMYFLKQYLCQHGFWQLKTAAAQALKRNGADLL